MIFTNDFNGYARKLQNELPDIERFAILISPLITHELCEYVFSRVTTHFDDTHKPEYKGNILSLENLLDKLIKKHRNPKNEEEQWFKNSLEHLRNRFDGGEDNQIGGEGLLWIFDESRWPDDPEIHREIFCIKDIILKSYLGGIIQGCYIHKNNLIGIFVQHLDLNKYEDFLSVFVHEMFHALHHFYLDENGCTESLSEYYHAVVLESLATYFQIKYLEYKGYLTKAEEIKNSVLSHSPIFNPYSGCERLFWEDNLFNNVIDWTKDDFEQALRQLVDKYDADIILAKKDYKSSDDCIKNIKKRIDTVTYNKIDTALDVLRSVFDGEWIYENNGIDDDCVIINGKVIHLFIVGQGQYYDIESQRGHIYAQQRGYPKMYDVRPNDIIFSYSGSQIKSINIALEAAEKTYGIQDGLRIDCLYSELTVPLDITQYCSKIAGTTAFDKNGHLKERGYIHHLDARIAKFFIDEIKKLGNRPR